MYSLVTMPGLAADLVRHRSATEVVDVLDRTLRLDRDEVSRLAAVYRDDAPRRRAWAMVCELGDLVRPVPVPADAWTARSTFPGAVPGSLPAGGGAGGGAAGPGPDDASEGPSALLPQRSGLSLAALLDCTREDLLGWTREQVGDLVVQTDPGAVHAVTDALGAAWAGHGLPPAATARLSAPWRVMTGELPVVAPASAFGPQSAAVRDLVDQLATMPGPLPGRLTEAYRLQTPDRTSGVRPWDVALRRACQAAFVTGRVREAAAAQLAAVRALLVAAAPGGAVDPDLAQVVAGTVQALVLRDQLDPVVHRFLVFAWEATVGPLP